MIRAIAFFLPQFHVIPENEAWWGKGFTEWTNVRAAKPLYRSHRQPRVPQNAYDLSDPKTLPWQASLAREAGIHGFCFYHYWFNGKLLLEKPLEQMLETGQPDFPFMLSWANEPWTKSWDGLDHEVLVAQNYGDEEGWRRHFEYLMPFFLDPRYIKVGGRPFFLIYRAASIPNHAEMMSLWTELAIGAGLPGLYFGEMKTAFGVSDSEEFDCRVDFEPMNTLFGRDRRQESFIEKVMNSRYAWVLRTGNVAAWHAPRPKFRLYSVIWKSILGRQDRDLHNICYRGAFVDWDNSPRKGLKALILLGGSARRFQSYMRRLLKQVEASRGSEFIFLNAWNEWGEGAYLEPDQEFGREYIDRLHSTLTKKGE